MKEIKDEEIFGPVIAFVYVIEFQKRGLPHVHFITFLSEKIRDTETVDKIICAEIPDEIKNPELFNIVKQFQVHGPCGNQNINSPCMDSEKKICTKYYPKPFCSETSYHSKNYPEYRRRKDGKQIIFYNKDGSIKCIADNSMIVPYNPYLSKKFECHITVMVCSSTGGIKYLFKYCYKGHDCAFIVYKDDNQEMQYDEIQYYLNTRYVCPPEAMHRLYEFPMHEQSHATYRLAVHLPNQQSICFQEGLEEEAVNKFKNTTLTAWFKLNAEDSEARKYLYTEIPHNYVFVESSKTWKVRQRITKILICRMYFVSPKDIERYFLRLLLLYVRGAKSFEDIKTYEGITYNTFTEAARARNLMVDDNEWNNCLTEAVSMKFPKELCRLLAYICVFGSPVNAIDLWNKYKEDMIFENDLPVEVSIQKSLILINEVFSFHGFSLHQFGLPHINQKVFDDYNSVSKENSALELQLLKIKSDCLIKSLNDDQRNVFNDIMMAVHNDNCSNRYIYLDGPGGSGKSYLHNTIITTVESEGLVVLSVAWTGIAANLLKGGRTAHSMFKFPIPINEDSTCNISGMSKHSELLRSAKIIIWDEITMAPKYALQAMEVMLRDITKCKKPFGGKVILLSGDFRQILPIVPHGSRTHIVEVCVKNSKLWHLFQTRSLHVNVRLNNNQINFSNWLLNVGDGKHQSTFEKKNNVLEIPQDLISNGNLIEEIYGSSISRNDVSAYSSCILSLTNSEVLDMNDRILSNSEGNEVVYYSIDSHVDEDQKDINNIVPVEVLNSLTPDGLPPHRLSLKEGCIIMLLRNMNLVKGLCNGTRLVVKSLLRNVISAEIIVGKSKGSVKIGIYQPKKDAFLLHEKFQLTAHEFSEIIPETSWFNSIVIDCYTATHANTWNDVSYMPLDISGKAIGHYSENRSESITSEILTIRTPLKTKLAIPYCYGGHYSVIVIDKREKTFLLLDPKRKSYDSDRAYETFLKYISKVKECSSLYELKGITWRRIEILDRPYQDENDHSNCGPFTTHYLECIGKNIPFDNTFDPVQYRLHIAHTLLLQSEDIKFYCMYCFGQHKKGYEEKICTFCKRWVHMQCIISNEDTSDEES
ncbi:uncharacterized protein LOC127281007, partial [Leptopilina boulardi]|uniref:uncharacterized protein LOC127281007 n=1 Tax=Leptopilina boulardi TaxID=63433 RepID=UPI0021F5216E